MDAYRHLLRAVAKCVPTAPVRRKIMSNVRALARLHRDTPENARAQAQRATAVLKRIANNPAAVDAFYRSSRWT